MNRRIHLLVIIAVALLSITVSFQEAQAGKKMKMAEILEALKPGQWVELEGVVQRDLTALCSKVKFLTGDFFDDDWEVRGLVRTVNKTNQEIEIMRLPVKVHKDTEFKYGAETFNSFADLKTDMLVNVEGTYLKDGTFLAKQVEDKAEKLGRKPDLKNEVQVVGRIGSVDTMKGTVTVMGILFKLTDRTSGKSAFK